MRWTSCGNRWTKAWTRFPFAPYDTSAAGAILPTRHTSVSGQPITSGVYAKASHYARPGERALSVESVSANIFVLLNASCTWRYAPEGTVAFPRHADSASVSLDFNRHSKAPAGSQPIDPSLNILYCDGHAAPASARDAWRAMRFN